MKSSQQTEQTDPAQDEAISRRSALGAIGLAGLSLATRFALREFDAHRNTEGSLHPEIEKYVEVNNALRKVDSSFTLSTGLKPLNFTIEKAEFLRNPVSEPEFVYPRPSTTLEEIRKRALDISIPESNRTLAGLMKSYRDCILTAGALLASRDNSESMLRFSERLFGAPTSELQSEAERLLRHFRPVPDEPQHLSAEEAADFFNKKFEREVYAGWRTELCPQDYVSVDRDDRILLIPRARKFGSEELILLDAHERQVHINRGLGGLAQPLPLFFSGFPNYLRTEEGLAVYLESLTGCATENKVRTYAGRALAVIAVRDGASFVETFRLMQDYAFTEHDAWEIAFRVHRGGGFLRDQCYLQGYLDVNEYVQSGGDIRELFVGKIGIEDLETVNELKEMDLVRAPVCLPDFIS